MNIFPLSLTNDPVESAQLLCDQHLVKMILESAQMLSTIARILVNKSHYLDFELYKTVHINHPCNLWLRESLGNIAWLYDHTVAMNTEYMDRRNLFLNHKSVFVARKAFDILLTLEWESVATTPMPRCFGTVFESSFGDDLESHYTPAAYREYYRWKYNNWLGTSKAMRYTNRTIPEFLTS